VFDNSAAFSFKDPFNYEDPGFLPQDSTLLKGADFTGANYSTYFDKVNFIGAFGSEDWLRPWTNFIPLKTNYNFPK
jgi:hypothetical protein